MAHAPSKIIECPVCRSPKHHHFITTKTMMQRTPGGPFRFSKCLTCQSVFLTNPVLEDELETYYPPEYLPYRGAAAWGKYASFVEKNQQKVDSKRVRMIGKLRNSAANETEILDIGCGNPTFLEKVSNKLKYKCTGIDFSEKGWAGKDYSGISLIKSSLEDYSSPKKFDIITLWHYLEHDYDLQSTANKLYELLKPGGGLVIEVPDYLSMTQHLQKEFWQGWHSPRHLTLFSRKGFQSLFNEDKWTIKQHRRFGTMDAFTLFWLSKMEKKGIHWDRPMEKEFWPLVWLKMWTSPFFLFERLLPLGIQTIVIEKNKV